MQSIPNNKFVYVAMFLIKQYLCTTSINNYFLVFDIQCMKLRLAPNMLCIALVLHYKYARGCLHIIHVYVEYMYELCSIIRDILSTYTVPF